MCEESIKTENSNSAEAQASDDNHHCPICFFTAVHLDKQFLLFCPSLSEQSHISWIWPKYPIWTTEMPRWNPLFYTNNTQPWKEKNWLLCLLEDEKPWWLGERTHSILRAHCPLRAMWEISSTADTAQCLVWFHFVWVCACYKAASDHCVLPPLTSTVSLSFTCSIPTVLGQGEK